MNKKTFRVQIENVDAFSALMNHFNWSEIDRVATGGMMSQAELLITFEGHEDIDPFSYIMLEYQGVKLYLNVDNPNGYICNSAEEFFSQIKQPKPFEIKKYYPNNKGINTEYIGCDFGDNDIKISQNLDSELLKEIKSYSWNENKKP